MGEVYRTRDTRLERDVALKFLPEAFSQDPQRPGVQMPDKNPEIRRLLKGVLQKPPDERAEFIRTLAAGDDRLRTRLEAEMASRADPAAEAAPTPVAGEADLPESGSMIGRSKPLQLIGEGGRLGLHGPAGMGLSVAGN